MLYQSPMPKSHNYIQCLFITYTAPLFVNRGRASSSLFTELLVPQMLQNFTIVLSSYSSRYVEIHRRNYSPMQVEVVKHMGYVFRHGTNEKCFGGPLDVGYS